ncbi:MAG: flagellar basal body L-ring protein FlgH [Chromatocurvus sp.]
MRYFHLAPVLAALLLQGCGGIHNKSHPAYAPIEPIDYSLLPDEPTTGGLFHAVTHTSLFSDVRAHRVGDIVSVLLVESTDATKSSDTELDKSNNVDITSPTIFGQPVTYNDRYNLGVNMESASSFGGEAASSQSNSLQGSIAVQVARVLPNGNLVVQGEKWIQINQGDEYIRLSGIIRPEDLSPVNSIPSTRVANARISYGGTGIANETNKPGWLTRFFMSPLVPF